MLAQSRRSHKYIP